ncbi:hypothetical protein CRUP_007366, partial [Coryphaenoides rupestris]
MGRARGRQGERDWWGRRRRREEKEEKEKRSQRDPARRRSPARVKGHASDQVDAHGQRSPEQFDHQASPGQTDAANTMETLSQPPHQHLLADAERRRSRRRLLGNIDLNKVFQAGTTCSPYHALALQECLELPVPEELPTMPWGPRRGGSGSANRLSSERENQ